jgi:hypothetical protein
LLGSSRLVWASILDSWNRETIGTLTGAVRDFSRPVAGNFSVPRDVVPAGLAGNFPVTVLHGPPMIGVTNALIQYARTTPGSLYYDGSAGLRVLGFLADRLSHELGMGVTEDDVRNWIKTAKGSLGLTLLVDGVLPEDLEELLRMAQWGSFRLILGMNSEVFKQASVVAGRPQRTALGRMAKEVLLPPLADGEMERACEQLAKEFNAQFFNGFQHVPELRWPRTLRVIAARLPTEVSPLETPQTTRLMIPPIPTVAGLLDYATVLGVQAELAFDLKELARSFLQEVQVHCTDKTWRLATQGRPSLDARGAEQCLGVDRVQRLLRQGFLAWRTVPALGSRLAIRVDELLGHSVAELWSESLIPFESETAVIKQLNVLLSLSQLIPGGDVALAACLFKVGHQDVRVFSTAATHLLWQRPRMEEVPAGGVLCLVHGDKMAGIRVGQNGDFGTLIANLQPWMVLSHLAFRPIGIDGRDHTMNASIFAELGKARHVLYQPRSNDMANAQMLKMHELPDGASLPCVSNGIVEPLIQSLLSHLQFYPAELSLLADVAINENDVFLGWRILTVASTAKEASDPRVSEVGAEVEARLGPWWQRLLERVIIGAADGNLEPEGGE